MNNPNSSILRARGLSVDEAIIELKKFSDRGCGSWPMAVPVDPGFPTIGGAPKVPLVSIAAGFDWDSGNVFFGTKERLAATGPEFRDLKKALAATTRRLDNVYITLKFGKQPAEFKVAAALQAIEAPTKRVHASQAAETVPTVSEVPALTDEQVYLITKLEVEKAVLLRTIGDETCYQKEGGSTSVVFPSVNAALKAACVEHSVELPAWEEIEIYFGLDTSFCWDSPRNGGLVLQYRTDFLKAYVASASIQDAQQLSVCAKSAVSELPQLDAGQTYLVARPAAEVTGGRRKP